jgi:DNA-binding FadR family transcriptional regulator
MLEVYVCTYYINIVFVQHLCIHEVIFSNEICLQAHSVSTLRQLQAQVRHIIHWKRPAPTVTQYTVTQHQQLNKFIQPTKQKPLRQALHKYYWYNAQGIQVTQHEKNGYTQD